MMKRMRLSAAFVLAALALAACSGSFRQPDISLEGVSVGSLGLTGGTLLANVRVRNPNRFTLRADDLRYQLFLRRGDGASDTSWVEFAQGTYGDTITVRGGQTRDFQIPVAFTYAGLRGAGGSLLNTGRVDYRATGTVDVRTPVGTRQVPFRKTGTFMMSGTGTR